MKFAVISDIHGNIVALRAALVEIARERADKILVLGDLFGPGHVQDILAELKACDAIVIRGNGEGYQLAQHRGAYSDTWARHDQFAATREIYAALNPADFHWLEALHEQMTLRYENFSLRMLHGSPWVNNESLTTDDRIQRALDMTDETVILCGHSHRASLHQAGGRYICNAGSVGENFDPAFTASVTFITCAHGEIAFDQRRVPYEFVAWRRVAGDLPYTQLALRGTELGRLLFLEFLEEASAKGGWPVPNNVWHGLFAEWKERRIL